MKETYNEQSISIDDSIISFTDTGGEGFPVIFIHGFPFNKSSWQPQVEFFQKSNRVIAYDIRGFGKSEAGKEEMSINLFADDLIKLMDGLQVSKAIVCGLSMGGYILLNAVSRYPERFEKIILADTQCIADSAEGREKRKMAINKIEEGKIMEYTEGFLNNVFCRASREADISAIEKIKQIILSTTPGSIINGLRALAQRSDICYALPKIAVPALVICGTEDLVTPVSEAEKMHAALANAKLAILENAGHMSNLEQPKAFNMQLFNFIYEVKFSEP